MWASVSDARIKQNIVSISNASDVFKKINPVTFNYTQEYLDAEKISKQDVTHYGFIAQEIEQVVPSCVYQTGDTIGEFEDLKAVNLSDLQVYAFAAIKELVLKVEALEAQILVLQSR